MANAPVHPIAFWNSSVMEEKASILLWLQYQAKGDDQLKLSPVYMSTAENTRALIDSLQKQLVTLEALCAV